MRSGCKKFLSLVAAVSLSVLGAANAQAGFTPVNSPCSGEMSQSQILSHSYGGKFVSKGMNLTNGHITAVRLCDSEDQKFSFNIASIKTLGAFSCATQGLACGNANSPKQLFTVTGEGYGASGSVGKEKTHGSYSFVRTGDGGNWSSDVCQNSDGADHLVTYLLTGKCVKQPTYVMFFEDGRKGCGDFDFNDLAVEVKAGCGTATVPLPAAAWSGLATLAGGVVVSGYRKARRQIA